MTIETVSPVDTAGLERAVRNACSTIDNLRSRLAQINTLACYASEENTEAKRDALLEIGKLARGEETRKWPAI